MSPKRGLEVPEESIDRAKLRQTKRSGNQVLDLADWEKIRSASGKKATIKIWELNGMRDEGYGIRRFCQIQTLMPISTNVEINIRIGQ